MKSNPFIKGGLPAEQTEEKKRFPLSLNIQFFAEEGDDKGEGDDDGDDDGDDGDDDDDDTPDLDELLKNPKFKAAHEAKLEKQLGRRLKKYNGIDPEEYRKLKAAADKAGEQGIADDVTEKERKTTEKLERAEMKLKNAAVKDFAIDSGVDPVLLVKFINMKELELDDDGEATNIDDLFEDLQDGKYAKYFVAAAGDDDDEEGDTSKKKKATSRTYNAGNKEQKTNKRQKVDPKELGKLKALERHKKKGE